MAKNICYMIKSNPKGFDLCPLCDKKLINTHLGALCSDKTCPYCDGFATLTNKQAKRYKDKIIR